MRRSAFAKRLVVLFLVFALLVVGVVRGAALLSDFNSTQHTALTGSGKIVNLKADKASLDKVKDRWQNALCANNLESDDEVEDPPEDTFDLKLSDIDEALKDGVFASWYTVDWLPGEFASGWVEIHNAGDIDAEWVLLTVEVETGDLHYIESETGDISVHDIDNWIIVTEMTYGGDDLLPLFTSLLGDNLPPLTMGELDEAAGVDLGRLAAGETKRLAMTFQLLPETGNDYQKDWAKMTLIFEAMAPQPDLGGTPGFWSAWDEHETYSSDEINAWLDRINDASQWLVDDMNGDGKINVEDMDAIFAAARGKGATMEQKFLAQYLATRLNVESDRLSLLRHRDVTSYDPDNYLGIPNPASTTIAEIVLAIEDKYDTSPSRSQFEVMKDICDALNNP